MIRCALLCTLAALLCAATLAGETPGVADVHVETALAKAGANRATLDAVLSHYGTLGDLQKLAGARFLIANMVDKGYIVTELRDKEGNAIPFDPLGYAHFKEALSALEALEKKHGELDFARDRKIYDLETITSDFLIRHIDQSFDAWRGTPEKHRVGFEAFLDYVLPYRGSQEPLDDWISPLRQRYAAKARALGEKLDPGELYKWLSKDVHKRVRFNERYYLHPTDQSFTEMGRSGQGRCEDITNMTTFVARSLAIATAADYTPYWAHRDNNHAWNVLLDANGKGSNKGQAHAAKIYRKTYAIQRDALTFWLAAGHQAPNRFMASTSYIDVTDQYAETTDVALVDVEPPELPGDDVTVNAAYLCVFNGGEWKAIHWSPLKDSKATFDRMGRGILYLPAVYSQKRLVGAGEPLIVHKDGRIERLQGTGDKIAVLATAVAPKKKSPDTHVVTPKSYLKEGETYLLQRWDGYEWVTIKESVAGKDPIRFEGLRAGELYWLVAKESRRLERPWTIENGRQRFW